MQNTLPLGLDSPTEVAAGLGLEKVVVGMFGMRMGRVRRRLINFWGNDSAHCHSDISRAYELRRAGGGL